MALVSCPECQHEVSSRALACPQCAYPHPGKQGTSEEKLQACAECGGVISKKAQLCPHCGISCTDVVQDAPDSEKSKDESWLCTHCGTPYTRKARKPAARNSQAGDQQSDNQQPPVTEGQEFLKPTAYISQAEHQPSDHQQPPITQEQEISFLQKMGAATPPAGHHHSPLWLPSSPVQKLGSSPSRKGKKGMIIAGIVLMVLVALSIMLWVLWEPNGTNPFEGLTLPTWSMNHTPPSAHKNNHSTVSFLLR